MSNVEHFILEWLDDNKGKNFDKKFKINSQKSFFEGFEELSSKFVSYGFELKELDANVKGVGLEEEYNWKGSEEIMNNFFELKSKLIFIEDFLEGKKVDKNDVLVDMFRALFTNGNYKFEWYYTCEALDDVLDNCIREEECLSMPKNFKPRNNVGGELELSGVSSNN